MSFCRSDVLLVVWRAVVVEGQVRVGVDVSVRVGEVDGLLGNTIWRWEVRRLEVGRRRRVTQPMCVSERRRAADARAT